MVELTFTLPTNRMGGLTVEELGARIGAQVPLRHRGGTWSGYGTLRAVRQVRPDWCDVEVVFETPQELSPSWIKGLNVSLRGLTAGGAG